MLNWLRKCYDVPPPRPCSARMHHAVVYTADVYCVIVYLADHRYIGRDLFMS